MTEFHRFMQKYKVDKGKYFTHTSIGQPKGSYFISDEECDEFMQNYIAAIERGETLHMTERHKEESPILIDLDFRFNDISNIIRKYTDEDVKNILRAYITTISQYIYTDGCIMYVLEKKTPRVERNKLKDGIHVIIPNLISEPTVQTYFREKSLPKIKLILDKIGIDNAAKDCFDEAVIYRNNWQMYGSSKPEQEKYMVTHIFKWFNGDLVEEYDNNSNYSELLSIRNKGVSNIVYVSEDVIVDIQKYMDTKKPKKNLFMFQEDNQTIIRNQTHNFSLSMKLVDILNPERADIYDKWIKLGWCLRNIDYRLLEKWVEFSQNSVKFVPNECESLWDTMKVNGGLGIGSLRLWASEDNHEQYKEIISEDIFSLICKALTGTHYDIACIVYAMFGTEHVCSSPKNKTWYEFRDHRWHLCEAGCSLSQKISVQVFAEFSNVAAYFAKKAAMSTDSEEQKKNMDMNKKFTNVALKLKDSSFKSNIMRECTGMFYIPGFEDKLDSKCHLIGFEDGIYDLSTMEFRDGMPEDYLSFNTRINYTPLNTNSLAYYELTDYFQKVFPIERVREYVLLHLASCLNGDIREERFHIWTGVGANSKSKIVELIVKSFGDYAINFPVMLLTGKRASSNAATSEIARAKGRRFAVLQEPSENEVFNCGLMKELSGGDRIITRPLYKEPIEFKPQFKMVLTANHLPEVKADDDGTWRRIRVVEFISKFSDNPNHNNPNEFLSDPTFSGKLDGWKHVFMSFLIEKYKEYLQSGFKEPEEVLKCTKEYQKNNDFVSEFLDACSQRCENSCVKVAEAYNIFKLWHHENNPDMRLPNRKEFIKLVSKSWGPMTRGKKGSQVWNDFKMNYSPDDGDGNDSD